MLRERQRGFGGVHWFGEDESGNVATSTAIVTVPRPPEDKPTPAPKPTVKKGPLQEERCQLRVDGQRQRPQPVLAHEGPLHEGWNRRFTRAIELDPNHANTRRWHALYLSSMGLHSTAAEEVQQAIELDPVSIASFDSAAAVASNARRFDAVLEYARRMGELDADDPRVFMHSAVGSLHLGRG